MRNLLPFEKKVLSGLEKCGILPDSVSENFPLGVAVSGGADSISLLLSLNEIFGAEKIRAVTVDHGIRSQEESGGDALFVRKLCDSLGVKCKVIEIKNGKIAEIARAEKKSVEEVARNFRYEAFGSFITEENLVSLCLAHNQNDQLETLLMRFLQGSAGEGMGGIPCVRGKFSRPLLDISRSEIESYLRQKNQSWRTDATNCDTKYLRNKIRNVLVPVLNENFSGWQKAVLSGARKTECDENFIKSEVSRLVQNPVEKKSVAKIAREEFYPLHAALKRRVFYSLLNEAGFGGRFPYKLFEEVASWAGEKSRKISFGNLEVSLESQNLVIHVFNESNANAIHGENNCIESGFSFLISKNGGNIKIDKVEVFAEENELNVVHPKKEKISFPVRLPVLVRSALCGDKIKGADGTFKTVSQIFSDWKIPEKVREKILVIEELSPPSDGKSQIRAVIASPFGFKNWIVDFHNL